jgi:hypothetical protein
VFNFTNQIEGDATMPRGVKRKAEPEAMPAEVKEQPRGAKTAATKQALIANPTKSPNEMAELLKEQGFEVSESYIRQLRIKMSGKKRKKTAKAAPAPAPEAAAPAVPKDAVSLGLLQKAKKLAAQFGSIKEAKTAIDALAQLLD